MYCPKGSFRRIVQMFPSPSMSSAPSSSTSPSRSSSLGMRMLRFELGSFGSLKKWKRPSTLTDGMT